MDLEKDNNLVSNVINEDNSIEGSIQNTVEDNKEIINNQSDSNIVEEISSNDANDTEKGDNKVNVVNEAQLNEDTIINASNEYTPQNEENIYNNITESDQSNEVIKSDNDSAQSVIDKANSKKIKKRNKNKFIEKVIVPGVLITILIILLVGSNIYQKQINKNYSNNIFTTIDKNEEENVDANNEDSNEESNLFDMNKYSGWNVVTSDNVCYEDCIRIAKDEVLLNIGIPSGFVFFNTDNIVVKKSGLNYVVQSSVDAETQECNKVKYNYSVELISSYNKPNDYYSFEVKNCWIY